MHRTKHTRWGSHQGIPMSEHTSVAREKLRHGGRGDSPLHAEMLSLLKTRSGEDAEAVVVAYSREPCSRQTTL
jgi:hypothetical protein